MFSISFSSKPVPPEPDPEDALPRMYVTMLVDGETTTFVAPLDFWSPADYRKQWKDGIARVLRGEELSCLLAEVRDPALHDGVTMVELHREGNDVFVSERYLLGERVPDDFDPRSPYAVIGPHPTIHVEPDGEVRIIRGTRIDLADIAGFSDSLNSDSH
jgi:hypothetical protein